MHRQTCSWGPEAASKFDRGKLRPNQQFEFRLPMPHGHVGYDQRVHFSRDDHKKDHYPCRDCRESTIHQQNLKYPLKLHAKVLAAAGHPKSP